ncbi:MAG: UTP--glucose-1-phosphate uridylyltransferase GalU, partial [Pseudomonadales bacterium]
MNSVTTAIIPVAGLGTRVLPASKAIPKEMLPIVDKPAIQYVVEEAVAAGIKTIILVTRSGKEAIENHFDSNYELESLLMQKGKTKVLEEVTNLVPQGVEIVSVRQDSPKGLGHAVLCARHLCQNDAFAVLLPDVLVFTNGDKTDLAEMVKQYKKSGIGQIMVEAVPDDKVQMYGIADCNGKNPEPFESVPIKGMVEKPSAKEAPSNLAMVGRYILPAQTMNILKETPPGAGNEVQLTDALETLLYHQSLQAYRMGGTTFDCGNKLGYLLANVHMGMKHPETGEGFVKALRSMLDS